MPHLSRLTRSSSPGFTLIEAMVAMSLSSVIMLAAFGLVNIAQSNTTRTTEQTHVDQIARLAMEKTMEVLHSACIVPETTPIVEGSTSNKLKIISEEGDKAVFPSVHLNEIYYTASTHKLWDSEYKSEETAESQYPNWKFPSKPEKTVLLAEHVEPAPVEPSEGSSGTQPIFRYYKYYREDTETHEYKDAGELETEPLKGAAESAGLSKTEAQETSKVAVAFGVEPLNRKIKEAKNSKGERTFPATILRDSAVYRLTPASTQTGKPNEPCS